MFKRTPREICVCTRDKAANNVIVVCKRYYLEVICKELDLWPGTTSSDTLMKPWTLKKSLGFKDDNLSDKFPSFHWTLKLHKTPYKHCFIASSFDCTTKLYSLPVPYLPSKGNCQICHQLYTVAQVSMKCRFKKQL